MIVEATAAHAEVMAAIHKAAFPDDPWDTKFMRTMLDHPGVFGFLDARGGVLLVRVAADEAEILTIGVIAARQGIGTALMQAAIEQARVLGTASLYLEAAAGNVAARALYKSLGFTEAGLRRKYYADGDDAVLLSLSL